MVEQETNLWSNIRAVHNHVHVLEVLQAGPRRQVDLIDQTDRSRSSIRRSLNRLEDSHLIESADGGQGWMLTIAGHSALDIHQQRIETWGSLFSAAELLTRLPADTDIGCRMMHGMDVHKGTDAAPHAAFAPVEEAIRVADHVRGFAPLVVDRYVDVVYDAAVNQGTQIKLVLPKEVIFSTVDNYPTEWQEALAAANCAIWRMGQVPDFGLVIADTTVYVGIYGDGSLDGVLINDTPDALEWAAEMWECCRVGAETVIPIRNDV